MRRKATFTLTLGLGLALVGCLNISLPSMRKSGSHWEEAIYRDATTLTPDHTHAHWSLGRRAMAAGEYRVAISHLRRAAESNPEMLEVHIAMGTCWLHLSNHDRARAAGAQALVIAPQSVRTHELLGRIELDEGNLAMAEEHFRIATANDQGSFTGHSLLGEIAYRRGNLDEALDHWHRALRCDADDAATAGEQGDLSLLVDDLEVFAEIYGP